MQATAYISHLCPRCRIFLRQLAHVQAQSPAFAALHLEVVDVLRQPMRTWRAGIRMIPALQIGDALYTALLPRQHNLHHFLAANLPDWESGESSSP